jgi:plasmid maintenance system antidote protein VapI
VPAYRRRDVADVRRLFWLGLQADFDLDVAAEKIGKRLREEVMVRAKAG